MRDRGGEPARLALRPVGVRLYGTAADARADVTGPEPTGGSDSPTGELWGHAESEQAVYLDPYIDLEPESLFLAEVDDEPNRMLRPGA